MANLNPSPEEMARGARIRQIIDMRFGGNSSEFAREIGVTPQNVYQWERGQTGPKDANLRAVCRAGGVSIDWVLNGEGAAPAFNATAPDDIAGIDRSKSRSLPPNQLSDQAQTRLAMASLFVALVQTLRGLDKSAPLLAGDSLRRLYDHLNDAESPSIDALETIRWARELLDYENG